MQGLGKIKNFTNESKKDCENITSIEEINAQYDYEDSKGLATSGYLDWSLISCGQDGSVSGYNELQRFYHEYIPDSYKGLAFHNQAMKILCECCKELSHEKRTHKEFKKCVGEKLGIEIK